MDDEWEIDSSGLKPIKRLKRGPGSFLGGKIKYGAPTESELKERKKILSSGQDSHGIAKQWSGRLPICPYGCDQEGQLQEIIVTPGRGAVGLYKDSEGLVFTAPMKMRPKPSMKAIVIGPDGEPMMTDTDSDTTT